MPRQEIRPNITQDQFKHKPESGIDKEPAEHLPEINLEKKISPTLQLEAANKSIRHIILRSKDAKTPFGTVNSGSFEEKTEAKILKKAWLELIPLFPDCIFGGHCVKEYEIHGIVIIDELRHKEPSKVLHKIVSTWKSRTAKLLNQFHGNHERIFWENSYQNRVVKTQGELFNILEKVFKKFP